MVFSAKCFGNILCRLPCALEAFSFFCLCTQIVGMHQTFY